ncbi:MAG: transporter substrate-binding domain-containing protein, partial [Clostridium sp.]|nr:transporter substrate-binding domain-containing protein [Clostridium sp.]
WDAKDAELNGETIDCIWNGFTINGREGQYAWTKPYVNNSQVFVVAADSGITNKQTLAGMSVAVQRDSSALSALNDEDNADNIALRDSFAELLQYDDYNTAFMDLVQGAVDAVAMDIGVAKAQIEDRAAGAFVILDEQLSTEQYGVGFRLGNEALRDQVQETIDEMVADGTFLEIATQWGLETSVVLD